MPNLNLPIEVSTYTFVLLVFVLLQGSLVLILVYFFIDRILTSRARRLDQETIKQEAYQKALGVLEDAKEKSFKLLTSSHEKARKVLDDVSFISEQSKSELDKQLKMLTQKQLAVLEATSVNLMDIYKKAIEEEKVESLSIISQTSGAFKEEVMSEISKFEDVLHKETVETESELKEEVTKEYEGIKKELEEYKKNKLSYIDENIYDIISQVTKEILGKSLSVAEHEDIVIRLLEEAKRKSKFSL